MADDLFETFALCFETDRTILLSVDGERREKGETKMSIDVAETSAEITEAIEEAAKVVAHEVFGRFCGKPETYTIGSYAGETDALTEAMGRAPTAEETARLEPAVVEAMYDRLGAMADAHAG